MAKREIKFKYPEGAIKSSNVRYDPKNDQLYGYLELVNKNIMPGNLVKVTFEGSMSEDMAEQILNGLAEAKVTVND